jgi:competence protein ComEA
MYLSSSFLDQAQQRLRALHHLPLAMKLAIAGNCLGVLLVVITLAIWVSQANSLVQASQPDEAQQPEAVAELFVEVSGAVARPGVYKLPLGSRVADAISQAEGPTPEADQLYIAEKLNQAQLLTDTQKIYLPFTQPTLEVVAQTSPQSQPTTTAEGTCATSLSVNSATADELEGLPVIGEKTAGEIVAARPYLSLSELVEKEVISAIQLAKLTSCLHT